jgi:hypothetical protein
MTFSNLKSYCVYITGVSENDICIPTDEDIGTNQRIWIKSIDWEQWQNVKDNYLTVAYSEGAKIIRLLYLPGIINTGVQMAGSKYLNVALPWGYKFVIAWKTTQAAHMYSCSVLYQIETSSDDLVGMHTGEAAIPRAHPGIALNCLPILEDCGVCSGV